MSYPFDPAARLVTVPVRLTGPVGTLKFTFAVDTAATRTAVSGLILQSLGYAESQAVGRHQVRTGSGGTRAGLLPLTALTALEQTRAPFPVLWLPLPPATMIDGLLGLDFFRGQVLTLDFVRGRLSLGPGKAWWQFWK